MVPASSRASSPFIFILVGLSNVNKSNGGYRLHSAAQAPKFPRHRRGVLRQRPDVTGGVGGYSATGLHQYQVDRRRDRQ